LQRRHCIGGGPNRQLTIDIGTGAIHSRVVLAKKKPAAGTTGISCRGTFSTTALIQRARCGASSRFPRPHAIAGCCRLRPLRLPRRARGGAAQVETVTVTLELPVSAPLSSYVRALEASRDAQTDQGARQALAAVTALASRGLVITVGKSIDRLEPESAHPRPEDDPSEGQLRASRRSE
jgi:hypothetical protein